MPTNLNRLTALKVSRLSKNSTTGLHADGGGLYLQIKGGGASWLYRYKMNGRKTSRDMGLGSLSAVSLSTARQLAANARSLAAQGVDPIEQRRSKQIEQAVSAAKSKTFRDCAEEYIAEHSAGWKNDKHIAQWKNTLSSYAYPVFGHIPVSDVDTNLVLKALKPIWKDKNETASRIRGRIESILGFAKAHKYRSGENPARWRDHLDKLLVTPSKVQEVKHHPALPFAEVGEFIRKLKTRDGIASKALEFLILTAARTGEVAGAKWDEYDMSAAIWTVPANRMKGKKEHRIPLSKPALAVLKEMRKNEDKAYVFPGGRKGRPMSENAMLSLLKRMKRSDITVHGFRSTFRDWAAETTNYPREVAEMALAHSLESKVEAAYRRGDLFKKRTRLMNEWAEYCSKTSSGSEVIPMQGRKRRRG